MLDYEIVACPYCGESVEIALDPTDRSDAFIEDCHVCCRPIEFQLTRDDDGVVVSLTARSDDD